MLLTFSKTTGCLRSLHKHLGKKQSFKGKHLKQHKGNSSNGKHTSDTPGRFTGFCTSLQFSSISRIKLSRNNLWDLSSSFYCPQEESLTVVCLDMSLVPATLSLTERFKRKITKIETPEARLKLEGGGGLGQHVLAPWPDKYL